MGLRMWRNGDVSEVIYKIIEHDFKLLGRYLSREVRSLSTEERNSMPSDYLSEGLVVFDKDQKRCLEYNNGKWEPYGVTGCYTTTFSQRDWMDDKFTIKYDTHLIVSPTVQVFILQNGIYEQALGGVSVNDNHDVILMSDIPFDGKVMIK